jgi:hypothetical protein
MTNKVDNLTKRLTTLGEGREISEGVPREGFADPTGEFPARDHFFGTSINKAARGERINKLYNGGGDHNVSVELADQKPSEFPYNQVNETQSGHSIEIDDTPGGERILIKHKSGAGVEFRSDGSVLYASKNKRVDIVGGDNTVVIEGEADLVYNGNLNIKVTGDYNLDVGGNINVKTSGDMTESIHRSHTVEVVENQNTTVKGDKGVKVLGMNTNTVLGDNNQLIKGKQRNYVEGDVELTSGNKLITTAVNEWAASALTVNISGFTASVMGFRGTIGGEFMDHYGKAFSGPPGGTGLGGTTFYGSLIGKATESITSLYANRAGYTPFSEFATTAGSAPTGPSKPKIPKIYPMVMPYVTIPPTAPMPIAPVVTTHLYTGNYGIREVEVDKDDKLKKQILKTDEYGDLFNYIPTIHEIRSKMRDKSNRNNSEFTGNLIAEGRLSNKFRDTRPKKIGRTNSNSNKIRFGETILGNNPPENRSKRFLV